VARRRHPDVRDGANPQHPGTWLGRRFRGPGGNARTLPVIRRPEPRGPAAGRTVAPTNGGVGRRRARPGGNERTRALVATEGHPRSRERRCRELRGRGLSPPSSPALIAQPWPASRRAGRASRAPGPEAEPPEPAQKLHTAWRRATGWRAAGGPGARNWTRVRRCGTPPGRHTGKRPARWPALPVRDYRHQAHLPRRQFPVHGAVLQFHSPQDCPSKSHRRRRPSQGFRVGALDRRTTIATGHPRRFPGRRADLARPGQPPPWRLGSRTPATAWSSRNPERAARAALGHADPTTHDGSRGRPGACPRRQESRTTTTVISAGERRACGSQNQAAPNGPATPEGRRVHASGAADGGPKRRRRRGAVGMRTEKRLLGRVRRGHDGTRHALSGHGGTGRAVDGGPGGPRLGAPGATATRPSWPLLPRTPTDTSSTGGALMWCRAPWMMTAAATVAMPRTPEPIGALAGARGSTRGPTPRAERFDSDQAYRDGVGPGVAEGTSRVLRSNKITERGAGPGGTSACPTPEVGGAGSLDSSTVVIHRGQTQGHGH